MVKGNNPFATGMSVLPGIEILEEPKSKRKPGKKVAKVVQIEKNSSNVSSSDPSGLPSYAESQKNVNVTYQQRLLHSNITPLKKRAEGDSDKVTLLSQRSGLRLSKHNVTSVKKLADPNITMPYGFETHPRKTTFSPDLLSKYLSKDVVVANEPL